MKQHEQLRLVMHIGPHKTATTYMQANFHHNAEDLQRRGWLYPVVGERVATAHHDLSDNEGQFLRRKGKAFEDFLKVIRKADREGLNVLLSSEGFRRWKKEHFEAIREIIGERRLHVVYALRDPLDTLYSFWAQKASMGPAPSLPAWIARPLKNPSRATYLNPLREIGPVMELPGIDYTVLLFEEIRRRKLDIYAYFLQTVLDIQDMKATRPPANERLPIELTEFIRMLAKDSGFPTGRGNSRKALHIGQVIRFLFTPEEKTRIVATIAENAAGARRTLTLPRETRHFRNTERRLVSTLGSRMHPLPESGNIFVQTPATYTYYDEDELRQVPAVRELLQSAMRKTRKTYPPLAAMNIGKRMLVNWRKIRKHVRF
ncbi:hypothetical protein SAMN05892877_101212 [Rhizobium subbaraonis]|uniref:Sulfotransferase family protein n=1 Tax=Rhizobium subbaraonis TaxID=908946 RepID=A0A285TZP1_9HYPH|nr:hypothetical protein [Rhizobium subbaraonis]SOC35154.1 hypothetical protein SAMN05892877_101212 [Rhizobium subbaraonis]